jgi:hypothetical protein
MTIRRPKSYLSVMHGIGAVLPLIPIGRRIGPLQRPLRQPGTLTRHRRPVKFPAEPQAFAPQSRPSHCATILENPSGAAEDGQRRWP